MSYRIETWNETERYKWACPTPHRHRNWRVTDGLFECRQCGETFDRLYNLEEQKEVSREEIELVGPHANHLAAFDYRTEG